MGEGSKGGGKGAKSHKNGSAPTTPHTKPSSTTTTTTSMAAASNGVRSTASTTTTPRQQQQSAPSSPATTPASAPATTPAFFFVAILFIALVTTLAVAMNSKHSPVLVSFIASDASCGTCTSMMGKVSLDMELRSATLGGATRNATNNKIDVAAKKAAAEILSNACDTPALGGKHRKKDKESPSADKKAGGDPAATTASQNETTCLDIVVVQKKHLLRYILNLTRGAGTPINANAAPPKPAAAADRPKKPIATVPPPTTSEICYPYCEARMGAVTRAFISVLRLPSHPSVVGTRNLVNEVWGTVLLLGAVGVLLGTILQARVRASRLRYAAALKRRRIQQWKDGKVGVQNLTADAAFLAALTSDISAN